MHGFIPHIQGLGKTEVHQGISGAIWQQILCRDCLPSLSRMHRYTICIFFSFAKRLVPSTSATEDSEHAVGWGGDVSLHGAIQYVYHYCG